MLLLCSAVPPPLRVTVHILYTVCVPLHKSGLELWDFCASVRQDTFVQHRTPQLEGRWVCAPHGHMFHYVGLNVLHYCMWECTASLCVCVGCVYVWEWRRCRHACSDHDSLFVLLCLLLVAMLAYRTYTTKMHMKRNPGVSERAVYVSVGSLNPFVVCVSGIGRNITFTAKNYFYKTNSKFPFIQSGIEASEEC